MKYLEFPEVRMLHSFTLEMAKRGLDLHALSDGLLRAKEHAACDLLHSRSKVG